MSIQPDLNVWEMLRRAIRPRAAASPQGPWRLDIEGGQAAGQAVTDQPLLVGLQDDSGNAQPLRGTSSGLYTIPAPSNNGADAVAATATFPYRSYANTIGSSVASLVVPSAYQTIAMAGSSSSGTTNIDGQIDADIAEIYVDNRSGQTINALSLLTKDTVGTGTPTFTYTAVNISIPNGQTNYNDGQPIILALDRGLLSTIQFSVGFSVNATSGTVTILVRFRKFRRSTDGALRVSNESGEDTYNVAIVNLATATNAGDVFVLTGSATKEIVIKKIHVSASVATAAAAVDVNIIRRNTADTAGTTSAATTITPMDSNAPAATATATGYTADPTVNDGTTNRLIDTGKFDVPAVGAITPSADDLVFLYGANDEAPLVLRGVAQQVAVNLNATGPAGLKLSVAIRFKERTARANSYG